MPCDIELSNNMTGDPLQARLAYAEITKISVKDCQGQRRPSLHVGQLFSPNLPENPSDMLWMKEGELYVILINGW